MAVDDPWAIDGLSLSALEWRRALSGLLAHDTDLVSARPGVLSGCGVTVAGLTATVAAGQMVVTPSIGSNGSYLVGLTATALAITAQDATYARIDRVIARIYDNSVDGSGQDKAAVEIVTGAPSAAPVLPAMPAGALELAQLQVPKAGTGITVVDKRPWTVANGGVPHFNTTAARDAAITAPGAGDLCTTGTGTALIVWCYNGASWVSADQIVQQAPISYVPGLTNVTLGTGGTVTGKYQKIGGWVTGMIQVVLGTGGALTGTLALQLPLVRSDGSVGAPVGPVFLRDNSAPAERVLQGYLKGGITQNFNVIDGATGSTVSSTYPWTWAAGDVITAHFQYPVA